MHVEVSVALNFLISYLYNKLPRRRVDLFGEELEKGLKIKFQGHWYPDKPFKGSGFRCVRCSGDKVDPVIVNAARSAGLDLGEVKAYIPEELTLWIDPCEVSYRISEKTPVKVLHCERQEEAEQVDREVQAHNHTFNPEALSFQPIDSLSSSLNSLSLSPSSPVPPGTWSNNVSPSSALFSSLAPVPHSLSQPQAPAHPHPHPPHPPSTAPTAPVFLGKPSCRPQFTAASFAATKFGSTKLKSHAKRPTRLSPTELGNYFRQQQRGGYTTPPAPQRPRSLSPRDPRLEFLLDQQQRFYCRGQLSPQGQPGLQQQPPHPQHHHHQQMPFPGCSPGSLSPGGSVPYLGLAESGRHTPSPHLSPGFPDPPGMHSPPSSLSPPDGHKTFLDGLQQMNAMHGYPNMHQLLLAN